MTSTSVFKPQVLAPAGSFDAFSAALKAGADAVYFGVEQLNMRARATMNFTVEDLPEIARRGKEAGISTYLTLNTILYDHDRLLMRTIIDAAAESGITAVIAADPAVLNYARSRDVAVHLSTQANISNIDAVEFYAAFADVMVLARELSLKQVAQITKEISRRNICGPSGKPVGIEIFAHGALCMAISGKCYLSLHSDNASANRGACIQNCRHSYIVTDKESGNELEIDNEYIMSAKDLCTISFLDKIVEAGVQVLKIEGRGRSADYVYTTTKCYREAVDALADGTYSKEKIDGWMERLATVYNRGFWDGYYLGRKMGEWSDSYGSKATRRKIYLGKAQNYFAKAGVGQFFLESHGLGVGDEIMVSGPTTGFFQTVVSEIRVDDQPAVQARKGDVISIPVPEKVRLSDSLYKVVLAE
jgi:putative protease